MTIYNIKDTNKDVLFTEKDLIEKLIRLCKHITQTTLSLKELQAEKTSNKEDKELIDDLEKLTKEEDIPDWVICGGSD